MVEVNEITNQIEKLPTLPVVVAKINELVNSDTTSAADINNTLSKDIALSSRILKIVNSSFYGFQRRINSITQAVVILGFHSIRNLAFSSFLRFFQMQTHREYRWEEFLRRQNRSR